MPNPLANDLDHIIAHTEGLWEELRGQRIFITGGTGFFGCWLLESFTWANDKLNLDATATVLTRNLEAFRQKAPHLAAHPAIRFHSGDVRTFAFPDGKFSHVIHAATEASARLNAENPLLMLDTIIEGTRRTLDFAVACGAQKFLLTSSGAVYGKQPPEMTHIPEEYNGAPDPLDPASAYGEGKRAAELLCTLYHQKYGLQTLIARCFAFVGPYLPLDAHFAIGNFIRDALKGGPIVIKGDGTPYRSYLYAADLTIWLWTILMRGLPNRAYNVGSEAAICIGQLANETAKRLHTSEVIWAHRPEADKFAQRYVPATHRASEELKLMPSIHLALGIDRTATWAQLMKKQQGLTSQ
jgi:dTDP-glucose 4,6-dehydratase